MTSGTLDALDVDVVELCSGGRSRTVRWGPDWHLGSPSFWVAQVASRGELDSDRHALGRTLREELAACMLGGFGLPAAVGLAAFEAVRARGHLKDGCLPDAQDLFGVLSMPLVVHGRRTRYRFAAQRSERLAAALSGLSTLAWQTPLELRSALLTLPGVGPKTASWVVRNHTGSDDVAIVDVHLLRAGVMAGVFSPQWTPARDYSLLEGFFLAWAQRGAVSAADLDAVIWSTMAHTSNVGRVFGFTPASSSPFLVHAS